MFLAIGTGMFTSVADAGSTIVALPTIASQFGTDLPTTQWVVVAYLLTISALLVPIGRLSDILGRKRIYIAGFCIFAGGALLAAFSDSVTTLVLARVLMGIGAAMSQGPSMAIMISAFPPGERGKALGLQMSAVGTGAVAGPALGGLIVSSLGWRGIFFATSALGLISAAAAAFILRPDKREKGQPRAPFDWLGAFFSAGFLVLFLLGMSNGPKIGWASLYVIASCAGAALLLGFFLWWELRAAAPMLDIRYFKQRIFSVGVISRFVMFMGMSSVRYLMPFYFQSILGFSARSFGLIAIPAAVCTIIVSPLAGRLSDRYGWKRFAIGGLIVGAIGLFLLGTVSAESSFLLVVTAWVLQSIGHGAFSAPNNASVLSVVDRGKYGVMASFVNMVRNAGNVTGTALATAIVTSVMVSRGLPPTLEAASGRAEGQVAQVFTTGMSAAYIATAVLICLALALHLLKESRGKAITPDK
ncbi:MAG: DHA2 family efflux MFS transporter permease subunit [Spirochaetales bacterium]|nr:DHA2 family efflux MFS transporter permease subunit [Spirochaetales bacterium]